MVAGSQPAAVPAQLDFYHPPDRNRRAGSADAQLAAGNGCRCADRLRSEPAPGRARRISDPADHLNQAVSCALPSPGGQANDQRGGGSSGDGGELLPGCRSGEVTSADGALGSTSGGVTSGGFTSGALTWVDVTSGGFTSGAVTWVGVTTGGFTSGAVTWVGVTTGGFTSGAVTWVGVTSGGFTSGDLTSGGAASGALTSECRIFGCG